MATSGQPARNAVTPGTTKPTGASRSQLIEKGFNGTAGTAGGKAESSTDPIAWAAMDRGISAQTLGKLNVVAGTEFFPDLQRRSAALIFRYREGWKARAVPDKSFVAGGGFKGTFWNLERVLKANPERVFITEGEMDACALVEAGISEGEVLSVPNGAKEKPAEDPKDQRGYGYVLDALKAGLSRVKRFVWCGDGDGPGLALRADMVKLLGAPRVLYVEWPEGAKDANEFLFAESGQVLREAVVDRAKQWPIEGLYGLLDLPEPAPLVTWLPGFPEWKRKVQLAPRTLSVVTGQPGHGKTMLFGQIWFQVAKEYGVGVCVASFETRAKPHIRRQLRSLLSEKLEYEMDEEEIKRADRWINERYTFMVHPDQRPNLTWFLDLAEAAVVRHGAKIIQLDPWNRLEAARDRNETETDYIGRCLRTLHVFAHDMNCHVQVIAHPAKMGKERRNGVPGLEDISASKNWDNMVDQGFVVYRPQLFDGGSRRTETQLYHAKARFEELGYPCQLNMDYVLATGRFRSTDTSYDK